MARKFPIKMSSGPEGSVERMNRKFDSEIIEQLVAIRMREQLPWKELPDRYMEFLPPDTEETKPHWKTLQKVMLGNIDSYLMPTVVHKKMRAAIAEEFDKADLGAMLINVLMTNYGEWNTLRMKMLYSAAATGLRDDDESRIRAPKFTIDDRIRMDELGDRVTATVFRLGDFMRSMHIEDNELFQLMERIDGSSPGPIHLGGVKSTVNPSPSDAVQMLKQVQEESKAVLELINQRHRKEGRGHYREILEGEYIEKTELVES